MAEMSGSAVADAAVMSKIFVLSMEKQGYLKPFAASVTATSATLGIIIPPSIPMVLYGVTTNTSIKDLFIGGIVPGLLLGAAFMFTSYVSVLLTVCSATNLRIEQAMGYCKWCILAMFVT